MDLPFLVLVLTLVAFGLVMLCSASSAVALYRRQDAFAYVRPQLLYAAMGLVAVSYTHLAKNDPTTSRSFGIFGQGHTFGKNEGVWRRFFTNFGKKTPCQSGMLPVY